MSGSITLLCGLPGCGKSTFLEQIQDGSIVLCPDDFRLTLTGHDYFAPAEDAVWSHVKVAARVLAAKRDVIIDATHLTIGSRSQWVRIAQSLRIPIKCIRFNVPYEICLERNNARSRVVPTDVMERMRDSLEIPTTEEGFESIHTVEPGGQITWTTKATLIATDRISAKYLMLAKYALIDHPAHGRLLLAQGYGGVDGITGSAVRWRHGAAWRVLPTDQIEELMIYESLVKLWAGADEFRPILDWSGAAIEHLAESLGL